MSVNFFFRVALVCGGSMYAPAVANAVPQFPFLPEASGIQPSPLQVRAQSAPVATGTLQFPQACFTDNQARDEIGSEGDSNCSSSSTAGAGNHPEKTVDGHVNGPGGGSGPPSSGVEAVDALLLEVVEEVAARLVVALVYFIYSAKPGEMVLSTSMPPAIRPACIDIEICPMSSSRTCPRTQSQSEAGAFVLARSWAR